VGNFFFDFTSLSGKQLTLATDYANYTFTFCEPDPELCANQPSSLCQRASGDANNVGLWSTASDWQAINSRQFTGDIYGDATWCDAPRVKNMTFQCVDGPAKFVSMNETASCYYEAVFEVPNAVCAASPPCCIPPVYTSTRLESDGTTSVAQADATLGNWFDSDFEDKGQSVLCVKSYDRCFTFTDTMCTGSAYTPAPSQCFGLSSDWTFIKEGALLNTSTVKQIAWFSRASNSYVVTVPLGGNGFCAVVSGNKVDTSFELGLTPNSTLWNVPKSCIKNKFGS